MASKFMAFEGVASTSGATSMNDGYQNDANERIEMNSTQYPNYQSNQNGDATPIEPSPYGAVDENNDLDEDLEEKSAKSVGYRKFIYQNSEQFKSICGGLLLLMGCGIHIVWGIFRVFNWYRCNEESSFYLRFVIWSWYIGAIMGSCTAGYVATKLKKRSIYFIGGALLLVSGMLITLSDAETNIYLLVSRVIGGFTQGLTYVIVIVHASENATKEFREFLMLIIGAVMNYSILISVLAFFHTEQLFNLSLLNGMCLFTFGICTMVITSKHATETIPFILQNNGSEIDALQTMGKLKKKPIAARSVHHDFLTLKNLVQDEMDHYGTPAFHKILLPENRKSLIFCLYGRLCSVLSFNLPLIVMIMLFLRGWVDESAIENGVTVSSYCSTDDLAQDFTPGPVTDSPYSEPDEIEIKAKAFKERMKRHTDRSEVEIKKPESVEQEEREKEKEKEKEREKDKNEKEKVKDEVSKKVEIEMEKNDNGSKVGLMRNTEKGEEENLERRKNEEKNSKHSKDIKNRTEQKDKSKKEEEENEKSGSDDRPDNEKEKDKVKEREKEKHKHHHQHHHNEPESEQKVNKKQTKQHKGSEEERTRPGKEKELSKNNKKPETGKQTEKEENQKNAKNEDKSESRDDGEKSKESLSPKLVGGVTFFGHIITFLHSRELTLILLAWFVFGTLTASILYTLNLRRFIYYAACALSSALAITGIVHSFHLFSGILHFCLIVYFNYVTIPIDLFSHCMLAEAFPVTLKAFSIAGIACVEHTVHIIIIALYMTEWFHDSIILFMCIVAFVSHEIARNLPQQTDLTLAEAREQYQNIDLMLFNEPKISNNQQQEFI